MPFLKNVWYVAGWANELDNGLVSRMICNELVVLYRTSQGRLAALEDRCPHRFVRLSLGKQVGDTVMCGYHGLRFGPDGGCVEMPNDPDNRNLRPKVRSFPAVEQDRILWIWMGEPELADPHLIPRFAHMTDKSFSIMPGYSRIKANYELISDNLLDLSHVHYLHPHIHAGSDFANFTNEVRKDGDTIWSMLWRPHYHLDENKRKAYGLKSEDVEGQGHSRWDPPGVLLVDTAFWDHGDNIDTGIRVPSTHLITPETEHSSHYFWAAARNFNIDDAEADRRNIEMLREIFETQDGPMIESQQEAMGDNLDFLDHKPVILRADAAGVMARRLMKKKMREEEASRKPIDVAAE